MSGSGGIIFKIYFIFVIYVDDFFCLLIYSVCGLVPMEARRRQIPEAGVTGSCEASNMGAENQT